MGNHEQATYYLTQIRTYPVNVSVLRRLDGGSDVSLGRIELKDQRMPGPVEFRLRALESFRFNERGSIQAAIPLEKSSGDDFDHLTIMVLPTGAVATILVRRLETEPSFQDIGVLQEDDERSFELSNEYSGLVFEFLSVLERKKLISHALVAPLDVFEVAGRKKKKTIDRNRFVEIMEWRAWGSGGYVSIQRCENGSELHSDVNREQGVAAEFQDKRALIPCQGGDVWTPYENCYVWLIRNDAAQMQQAGADIGFCSDADACDQELIRKAVEPLLYAVSLRSVCASGVNNVKAITRAFADLKDSRIRISELRRYIGETRLSILAVKEYEESSDKVSRMVYRKVSEDIQAEHSVAELRRNLADVADELQVVQSERAEARQGRMNSFAFMLTALFGVSAMVDLITFLEAPMPNWLYAEKLTSLAGYGILIGLALIVIKVFPGR